MSALSKLESLQQFKQAKTELKRRYGKLHTNTPIGYGWLEEAIISSGYIAQTSNCLAVCCDEETYRRLYYLRAEGAELPDFGEGPALIVEEPDAGGNRAEYLSQWYEHLESRGWTFVERSVQVELDLDASLDHLESELAQRTKRIRKAGVEVAACTNADDAREVIKLWRDHLKIADVPKKHLSFLDDSTQKVVCAFGPEGVCGTNWWQVRNTKCEIRHIVTSPARARQGIGYAMLLTALCDAGREGCKTAYTYISEDNVASLGMFGKAGFALTNRTSTQYILK